METATIIGFGVLILFLVAVIIRIWQDNRQEAQYWDERIKNNKNKS